MSLDIWKQKIQEKRKNTPFLDFITEIGSWKPIGFYRNKWLISRYPETPRVGTLLSPKEFLEVRDALPSHEYDFSKTFLENFQIFYTSFPLASLTHFNTNENCDFSDCVFTGKNVYLSQVIGIDARNIYYSSFSYGNISDIFNSFMITKNSSYVFQSVFVENSFQIFYSRYILNSSDIWFSTNLVWCQNCILCDWLQNCSYFIKNESYSKEEYLIKKEEILREKEKFETYYASLNKKAINYNSKNCTWNALYFCENVENGYFFTRLKNGRNVMIWGLETCEDFYDCIDVGDVSNNFYACCSVWEVWTSHMYCCTEVGQSQHIFYSYHLERCSFCIGCIGLRNKHFHIFNREYSKEEWYKKADEIFRAMDKEGTLGKFFSPQINPFYYNDTLAYKLNPTVKKDEITALWYLWREEKLRVDVPERAQIIPTTQIQEYEWFHQWTWKIKKEITERVISDEEGNYYRIIPEEYEFHNKYWLPLPRLHWSKRLQNSVKF